MTTASKPWYCRSSRREVAAEALVADHLAAEAGHALVLGLEDLDLGQAVLRDAVAEHPARRRVALEDGDVVAVTQQVVGGGHAGRPGADDGRAAAGLRLAARTGTGGSRSSSSIDLMTMSPA